MRAHTLICVAQPANHNVSWDVILVTLNYYIERDVWHFGRPIRAQIIMCIINMHTNCKENELNTEVDYMKERQNEKNHADEKPKIEREKSLWW